MAKATPKTSSSLQKARDFAQYFTMTAAVVYGLFWLIVSLTGKSSNGINNTSTVLMVCVSGGGILMGVLYAVASSQKK